MGVKGRRVAVVEELSKTVISFQKVDSKCKDRTLTITGSNQESIDYAKRLIEQTIRRNVSPNRVTSFTYHFFYYQKMLIIFLLSKKSSLIDLVFQSHLLTF